MSSKSGMLGAWLDEWTPRLLKLLGLLGVGVAVVQAVTGEFQPVLFGGSLTAASGGFLGDAIKATKGIRESIENGA